MKAFFARPFYPLKPRWRRFLLLACGASVSILLLEAGGGSLNPAFAQFGDEYWPAGGHRGYYREPWPHPAPAHSRKPAAAPKQHRNVAEKKQKEPEPAAAPSGPMFFVISLNKQHVSVYANDGLYIRSPVSTGMPGHPTPMGIFNIIGKERFHNSNIYSGAPMPFMQRITWSGVAMHEGVVPGYPASHGCIRLPHEFAKRMFGLTQGNERVIITRHDIAPAPFSHVKLPSPAMLADPAPAVTASISSRMLQNALSPEDGSGATGTEKVSVKPDGSGAPDTAAPKLLNPHDYALTMKTLATKKVDEVSASATPLRQAAQTKAKDMHVALVDLRKAQIALGNAKDRLRAAERRTGPAAEAEKAALEAKIQEAQTQVDAAQRVKTQKDQDMADAILALKGLDGARNAAAEGVKVWNRRLAPVSVFISRKTQRLYVRQNFLKVFDVPVTIRDPGKPLGTHLYMAMGPAKDSQASAPRLRWLALTLADGSAEAAPPRRHSRSDEDDDAPRVRGPAVSASAALERIEVPSEVSAKISEMLWTGGSLIVSDNGISSETDEFSDFIILTR